MKLIERFAARADDGTLHHIECWQDDTGLKRYSLQNAEPVVPIDDATFEAVIRRMLLRRVLSKGWPRSVE